tara:strand:- start:3822 stop:3953 length:132 start_codon:yes stop_codon:yes gene_type:complete
MEVFNGNHNDGLVYSKAENLRLNLPNRLSKAVNVTFKLKIINI